MFYAVCKENNEFEIWSDPCPTKNGALTQGEMRILDTYGSKDRKYMRRVNNLFPVSEDEAKYLKLLN